MPRKRKSNKLSSATDPTDPRSCNATRNSILQHLQEAFASNLEPDVVATVFAECDDNLDATMEALFVLVGEKPRHEEHTRSRGDMEPMGLTPIKKQPASGVDFLVLQKFEKINEEEPSTANNFFYSDTESSDFSSCHVDVNEATNRSCKKGDQVSDADNIDTDIDQEFENTVSSLNNESFFSSTSVSDLLNTADDSGINLKTFSALLEENKAALNTDDKALKAMPSISSRNYVQYSTSDKYFENNERSRTRGPFYMTEIKNLHENVNFNYKNNNKTFSTAIENNDQIPLTYKNDDYINFPQYSLFPSCNNIRKNQTTSAEEENPYFFIPMAPPSSVRKVSPLPDHVFNSLPIKCSSKLNVQSCSSTVIPKPISNSSQQQQIIKQDKFKNCDKKFRTSVQLILNKIQNNELVLIILRGLPGSGKSTLACQLQHNGLIFSTDNYFVCNGKYKFDQNKLSEAHIWNRKRTKAAMINKCTPIIIDNTNVEMWEMKPYIKLGREYRYHIEILEPNTPWKFSPKELYKKNRHDISKSKIIKMMERYQHNITIDKILCSKKPSNKNDSLVNEIQDDVLKQNEGKNINNARIQDIKSFPSTEMEDNKKLDSINQDNNSNESYTPIKNKKPQVNEAQNFFSNAYTSESPSLWKQYNFKDDQRMTSVTEKEIDDKNIKKKLFEENTQLLTSAKTPVSLDSKTLDDSWAEQDNSFDWNITSEEVTDNFLVMEEKVVSFSPKPRRNDAQLADSEKIDFQAPVETLPDSSDLHKSAQPKKFKNKIAANFDKHPQVYDTLLSFSDLQSGTNTASSDELEICLPLPEEMEELAKSLEQMVLAKAKADCLFDEDDIIDDSDNLNCFNWRKPPESNQRKKKSSFEANIAFLKDCFPSITEEVLENVLKKCDNDIDQATTMVINSKDSKNKLFIDTEPKIHVSAKNSLPKFQSCKKNETSKSAVGSSTDNLSGNPSSSSNDLNQISNDEKICLHLDSSFAQQLQQLFGPVSYCDESLKHVVYLDKEVAQRIHENWISTQRKAKKDNAEKRKLHDSAFDRNLAESNATSKHDRDRSGNGYNVENCAVQNDISNIEGSFESINSEEKFSNIEDLEFALQIYKNDMMKQLEQRWSQADLASKLKKQKLHELFPRIDQSTLDELLFANNFNLNDTVELIKTTVGDWDEIYAVEDEILESVKKKSMEMMKGASKKYSGNHPVAVDVDTLVAEDIDAANLRTEANKYYQLRQMYFNKAKEAYLKGMKPTALFYSHQAHIYSEKMWEANENASVNILLHFNRGTNDNTLDLHLLYVKEAMKVLEQFLRQKKLEQQRSNGKNLVLDIITGKGANSTHHIPRIKRAVISYLERNKYRFSEKNPGLIQVFL